MDAPPDAVRPPHRKAGCEPQPSRPAPPCNLRPRFDPQRTRSASCNPPPPPPPPSRTNWTRLVPPSRTNRTRPPPPPAPPALPASHCDGARRRVRQVPALHDKIAHTFRPQPIGALPHHTLAFKLPPGAAAFRFFRLRQLSNFQACPPPPPLVLSGHAASLTPYQSDTPRPTPRVIDDIVPRLCARRAPRGAGAEDPRSALMFPARRCLLRRAPRVKGRDASSQYGKRDETCPVSTGRGTRRVQLVREGGGGCAALAEARLSL